MMILNTRSSKERVVSHKRHKLRPKGLHQVQLGPPAMTNQRVKTQTDLRSKRQALIGTSVERRDEGGQPQAGPPRPARPSPNSLASDQRQCNRLHQAIRSIHTKVAQNSTEILGRWPAWPFCATCAAFKWKLQPPCVQPSSGSYNYACVDSFAFKSSKP